MKCNTLLITQACINNSKNNKKNTNNFCAHIHTCMITGCKHVCTSVCVCFNVYNLCKLFLLFCNSTHISYCYCCNFIIIYFLLLLRRRARVNTHILCFFFSIFCFLYILFLEKIETSSWQHFCSHKVEFCSLKNKKKSHLFYLPV